MEIFGRQVTLPDGQWEERSVYTLVFEEEAPAAPSAVQVRGAGTEPFQTNVVVTRTRTKGEPLATLAARQHAATQEALPGSRILRSGPLQLDKVSGQEMELSIPLPAPRPTMRQWHVLLERDGFAYSFCCSALEQGFDRHKPRFFALVESWSAV